MKLGQSGKNRLIALIEEIRIDILEPKRNNREKGISTGLFWTIIAFLIPIFFFVGYYFGNTLFNKDAITCFEEKSDLKQEMDSLKIQLRKCLSTEDNETHPTLRIANEPDSIE